LVAITEGEGSWDRIDRLERERGNAMDGFGLVSVSGSAAVSGTVVLVDRRVGLVIEGKWMKCRFCWWQ
jgi:hypothetical protein